MNNDLIPLSDILTKTDLFNIETEATQKAYFLATTQKQFELLYSKYYLELIQKSSRTDKISNKKAYPISG